MSRSILALSALITVGIANATAQSNTFPSSGNVGIGTTSPSQNLEVNGTVQIDAGTSIMAPNNFGVYTGGNYYFRTGTPSSYSEKLFIGNNGNVGIGTTSPAALLSLEQESGSPSTYDMLRFNTGYGPIQWGITGNSAHNWGTTFYSWQPDNSNNGANLAFATGYGTTVSPNDNIRMMIVANGNVGIGTTGPGERLEVNGNLKLTAGSGASIIFPDGTTQSTAWSGTLGGGDYAESVDVTGERSEYEPGDVLVVDPEHPGHFLKATEKYSTLVAGIYSTKPGMIGRRQTIDRKMATTEIPMAMVPTKVTTENGPIHAGDVLVTSTKPGYAMKGTDRTLFAGAIVGKALGSLDSGTGMVEVLVSLQ